MDILFQLIAVISLALNIVLIVLFFKFKAKVVNKIVSLKEYTNFVHTSAQSDIKRLSQRVKEINSKVFFSRPNKKQSE